MMNPFDASQWIDEKKLELINLMFLNEFSISDFRNTNKVINFDELQTETMKNNINKYRVAMGVLFKAEEIRSILDYYYLEQDKKPALNLLKQILRHYGFEFERSSEYQGNYGGKKIYKSKYTIIPAKKKEVVNVETVTTNEGSETTVVEPQVPKSTVKTRIKGRGRGRTKNKPIEESTEEPTEDLSVIDPITDVAVSPNTNNKKRVLTKLIKNYKILIPSVESEIEIPTMSQPDTEISPVLPEFPNSIDHF